MKTVHLFASMPIILYFMSQYISHTRIYRDYYFVMLLSTMIHTYAYRLGLHIHHKKAHISCNIYICLQNMTFIIYHTLRYDTTHKRYGDYCFAT